MSMMGFTIERRRHPTRPPQVAVKGDVGFLLCPKNASTSLCEVADSIHNVDSVPDTVKHFYYPVRDPVSRFIQLHTMTVQGTLGHWKSSRPITPGEFLTYIRKELRSPDVDAHCQRQADRWVDKRYKPVQVDGLNALFGLHGLGALPWLNCLPNEAIDQPTLHGVLALYWRDYHLWNRALRTQGNGQLSTLMDMAHTEWRLGWSMGQ